MGCPGPWDGEHRIVFRAFRFCLTQDLDKTLGFELNMHCCRICKKRLNINLSVVSDRPTAFEMVQPGDCTKSFLKAAFQCLRV